jgi:hypothetical protein
VPKFSGDLDDYDGVMQFDLPNGWRLRLTYERPPSRIRASNVEAEFIRPSVPAQPRISRNGPRTSREDAHPQHPSP